MERLNYGSKVGWQRDLSLSDQLGAIERKLQGQLGEVDQGSQRQLEEVALRLAKSTWES